MKLTTYNLNGIRARLPRFLEWLERERPDIVCLQELKCATELLPTADVEALGYQGVWHGQKGFNGVAILARGEQPQLRREGLPGDPDDTHSRYIEAEVAGLIVASIYLPNGNPVGTEKFDYKIRWMERLREHSDTLLREERPVVLAGDWNVVPEDRDVFSIGATAHDAVTQPATRDQWRRLANGGWTDALRAFHPEDPKLYTFWDYTAGCWQRDLGFRLDHLLCSPEAADRLRGAGVDRWARGEEKASDHAPTWIELA
ncbi:exodeoxyribonuclease III [Sphingomonas sinipercae]|uniref:Exodeoxyribonuclease III n=1 Tax=Sphingomonas sinipercae TaxID=2714944 RepID=A0A6G7ZLZ2_9SPHN|nr:exodeoxyribonuclease III [Sphingomonas sinipercae]QIL01942.1 exodeoxyribonuclease III [Sphingomonas sinipercae]